MHFNLRKKAALLLAGSMMLSIASGKSAFRGLDTIAAENNGYTDKEIGSSAVQPTLSVSRIEIPYESAKADSIQSVSISIEGASKKYAVTGIHVYWDPRLTPQKNEEGYYATGGQAVEKLYQEYYNLENGFVATTAAMSDVGEDGVMYTFDLRLPEDIKGGDVYEISIVYEENEMCGDLFTNSDDNESGKLMQAWVFTRGIKNGYIKIKEAQTTTTTTTTTTTATSTSTTTTTASSTTTTTTPTTTSTSTSTSTTTTTTTTLPPDPTILYGDIDGDKKISAYDASLVLTEYAESAAGNSTFTADQKKAADVNDDGKIGADDAGNILTFYSYLAGNGTEKDIKNWLQSIS